MISSITEDLDAEVTAWRTRPLERVWPIVYFDGIVVHVEAQWPDSLLAPLLQLGLPVDSLLVVGADSSAMTASAGYAAARWDIRLLAPRPGAVRIPGPALAAFRWHPGSISGRDFALQFKEEFDRVYKQAASKGK